MTGTTVKLKRSSNSGGVPNTSDLSLGELAVNTHDGKVFTKKNVSGTESIVTLVSSDFSGTVNATAFVGDGSQLTNLPAAGGALSLSGGNVTGDVNVSGQIGVGTTSPLRLFDINNSTHATLGLTTGTSGQSSIFFADTDTNVGQIGYLHQDDAMFFRVADQERFRIDSSGNATCVGALQSGGNPNDGTAVGAKMLQSGVIQAARASGSGTSAVYMGFLQGTSTATSRINANGSAEFASNVIIGTDGRFDANATTDTDGVFVGRKNGTLTSQIAASGEARFTTASHAGVSFTQGGTVPVTGNSEVGFRINTDAIYGYEGAGAPQVLINNDGSASFDGPINAANKSGVNLNGAAAALEVQYSNKLFRGYEYATGNESVAIYQDGSAEFASSVVVGGPASDLTASNKNVAFLGNGPVVLNRSSATSSALSVRHNGTDKVVVKTEGSATFGDTYKVKIRPFNGANADQLQILDTSNNVRASITGGGSGVFQGTLTVSQNINGLKAVSAAGTGSTAALRVYSDTLSTYTTDLNADGSATFGSTLNVDGAEAFVSVDRNITAGTGALYLGFTQGVQKFKVATNGDAEFGNYVFNSNSATGVSIEDGSITSQRPAMDASTGRAHAHRYGSTITYELTNSGSATFGSTVTVGGAAINGTLDGVQLYPTGGIHATQASGSSTILSGYVEGSSTKNVAITAGGSATFAGAVVVNRSSATGDSTLLNTKDGNNVFLITPNAAYMYDSTGNATSDRSIVLSRDGSATFAKRGDFGSSSHTTTHAVQAQNNKSDRSTVLAIQHNSLGPVFEGRNGSVSTTAATSTIKADGSAQFTQGASDLSGGAALKATGTAYGTNKAVHAYINSSNSARSLIYAENASGAVLNVQADGISTFAGNVTSDGSFGSDRTSGSLVNFIGRLNGSATSMIKADGSAEFANGAFDITASGTVQITNPTSNADAIQVYGPGGNTVFARIQNNGDATFKGVVIANTNGLAVSDYAGSFSNSKNGTRWQASVVGRNHTSQGPVWAGLAYNFAASDAGVTSQIFENGDAEFLGTVSIGGRGAAHTIDEYEEGTWTPQPRLGNTNLSVGSNNGGSYTRIGRLIYLHARVHITSKNSGTGPFTVHGLPYTQGNHQSGGSAIEAANSGFGYMNNGSGFNSTNSNHVYIGTSINENLARIAFDWIDFNNGNRVEVDEDNVTSTLQFAMDIVYQV